MDRQTFEAVLVVARTAYWYTNCGYDYVLGRQLDQTWKQDRAVLEPYRGIHPLVDEALAIMDKVEWEWARRQP